MHVKESITDWSEFRYCHTTFKIPGALCFAELGLMIPLSGGEYSYLLKMYGGMIAFAYSWTASFILRPSSAVIVLTCAEYMVLPLYEGTECGAPTIAVKLVAVCIISKTNSKSISWIFYCIFSASSDSITSLVWFQVKFQMKRCHPFRCTKLHILLPK